LGDPSERGSPGASGARGTKVDRRRGSLPGEPGLNLRLRRGDAVEVWLRFDPIARGDRSLNRGGAAFDPRANVDDQSRSLGVLYQREKPADRRRNSGYDCLIAAAGAF
jgi:hypothetical protein